MWEVSGVEEDAVPPHLDRFYSTQTVTAPPGIGLTLVSSGVLEGQSVYGWQRNRAVTNQ